MENEGEKVPPAHRRRKNFRWVIAGCGFTAAIGAMVITTTVVVFLKFAESGDQIRQEALAKLVAPPEYHQQVELAEAHVARDGQEPDPGVQPGLAAVDRWNTLFAELGSRFSSDDRDRLNRLWTSRKAWDALPDADRDWAKNLLRKHPEILALTRRTTSQGGPVHAWHPHAPEEQFTQLADDILLLSALLALDTITQAREGSQAEAIENAVTAFELAGILRRDVTHFVCPLSSSVQMDACRGITEAFPPGQLDAQAIERIHMASHNAVSRAYFARYTHTFAAFMGRNLQAGTSKPAAESAERLLNSMELKEEPPAAVRQFLRFYCSPLGKPWLHRDLARTFDLLSATAELAALPLYEALPKAAKLETQRLREAEGWFTLPEFTTNYALKSQMHCVDFLFDQAKREAYNRLLTVGLTLEARSKGGGLPETLKPLEESLESDMIVDPFTGQSLVYRPEGTSFVLYSLGPNQEDDGGVHDEFEADIVWRGNYAEHMESREPLP